MCLSINIRQSKNKELSIYHRSQRRPESFDLCIERFCWGIRTSVDKKVEYLIVVLIYSCGNCVAWLGLAVGNLIIPFGQREPGIGFLVYGIPPVWYTHLLQDVKSKALDVETIYDPRGFWKTVADVKDNLAVTDREIINPWIRGINRSGTTFHSYNRKEEPPVHPDGYGEPPTDKCNRKK